VVEVRVVDLESLPDGLQHGVLGVADSVRSLQVLGVRHAFEGAVRLGVLADLFLDLSLGAGEVVDLVLELFDEQVDALDDLDLDQLLLPELALGADEEDDLDVGLLQGL